MKQRIVAAWRVLRGEWAAVPPQPTFTVYWNGQPQSAIYTSSGSATVTSWRSS